MAIRPTCDKCGAELADYGGILLSPPDQANRVEKLHLCKKCFDAIRSLVSKSNEPHS